MPAKWTRDSDAAVPLWRPATPLSSAVLAFTTRRGGVSAPPRDTLNLGGPAADHPGAVAENRRRVLAALRLAPGSGGDPAGGPGRHPVAAAGQIHGSRVVAVDAPGLYPACDALLTRVPGLALVVATADCMPILFATPGVVAAVHAGWRGTAAGMPRVALAAVCQAAGCGPGSITVHFGPCIRSCCYEVGPDVAARFPEAAVTRVGGAPHLDLVAAARRQLLEAGVAEQAITDTGACTACEPAWYFSHRRDHGDTGRHWGLAALRPQSSPSG